MIKMRREQGKVLVLNKGYYPWTGGVETVVRQVAEGLEEREFDIDVLACFEEFNSQRKEDRIKNVDIIRLPTYGSAVSTPISPSYIWEFSKIVQNYEIIHLHIPFPLGELALALTSLSKRQKLIITFHADPKLTRWGSLYKFYFPILNAALKKADKIIVTAPNNKINFPSLASYQDKTSVIPLAPDSLPNGQVEKTDKEYIYDKYGLSSDVNLVLFVGRLAQYKGLDYLIKAMQAIKGKLLIVGSGSFRKKLEKLSKKLGLVDKVIFTGFVENGLLPVYYTLADIFVLPSINEGEAFGIVQVEALNFGLPIVNTSLPTGVPFVGKDKETGYTVPPKDARELASAINKILNDKILYDEFSVNAKERARKFTKKKMIDMYRQIYEQLLE